MGFGKILFIGGASVGLGVVTGINETARKERIVAEHVSEHGPCHSDLGITSDGVSMLIADIIDGKPVFSENFTSASGEKAIFKILKPSFIERISSGPSSYTAAIDITMESIESGRCLNQEESK